MSMHTPLLYITLENKIYPVNVVGKQRGKGGGLIGREGRPG